MTCSDFKMFALANAWKIDSEVALVEGRGIITKVLR